MTPHEIATVKHVRLRGPVPEGYSKILRVIETGASFRIIRPEGVERETLRMFPALFEGVSIPIARGTRK